MSFLLIKTCLWISIHHLVQSFLSSSLFILSYLKFWQEKLFLFNQLLNIPFYLWNLLFFKFNLSLIQICIQILPLIPKIVNTPLNFAFFIYHSISLFPIFNLYCLYFQLMQLFILLSLISSLFSYLNIFYIVILLFLLYCTFYMFSQLLVLHPLVSESLHWFWIEFLLIFI